MKKRNIGKKIYQDDIDWELVKGTLGLIMQIEKAGKKEQRAGNMFKVRTKILSSDKPVTYYFRKKKEAETFMKFVKKFKDSNPKKTAYVKGDVRYETVQSSFELFVIEQRHNVKPTTIHDYYVFWSSLPMEIKEIYLKDLEINEIEKIMKTCSGTELMKNSVVSVFIQVLNFMRNEYADQLPLVLNVPKLKKRLRNKHAKSTKKEKLYEYNTPEEVRQVYLYLNREESNFSDYLTYCKLQILMCLGCRIGELSCLKLSDFSEDFSSVRISRTMTKTEDGRYIEGETTKTGGAWTATLHSEAISAAKFLFSPEIVHYREYSVMESKHPIQAIQVKSHLFSIKVKGVSKKFEAPSTRADQVEWITQNLKDIFSEVECEINTLTDPYLINAKKAVTPNSFTQALTRIYKNAEVPFLGTHMSCRATSITNQLLASTDQITDLKEIARRHGHKSSSTTIEHYAKPRRGESKNSLNQKVADMYSIDTNAETEKTAEAKIAELQKQIEDLQRTAPQTV